jgi:hypothetical protein
MPDKARFFVWKQHDRVIAFSMCMVPSGPVNAVLARILPLMGPSRVDPTLRRFPNYNEI